MSHSIFEISDIKVQFEEGRLDALLAVARGREYLADFDDEAADEEAEGLEAPTTTEALDALLAELFPPYYSLTDDLTLDDAAFEWWDGAFFPTDDMLEIFAAAAAAGSHITFIDFDDYSRSIYDIAFDGVGGHRRQSLI